MRKVWLISLTITALMVVLVLPAAAAVPCNKSNNPLNWNNACQSAITQPTVPSIPGNCQPVLPVTCDNSKSQCSNLGINGIAQQFQGQMKNCSSGCQGNVTCPTGIIGINCNH